MINKKLILIAVFIIGLLAVSAVSASDDNTDSINEDSSIIAENYISDNLDNGIVKDNSRIKQESASSIPVSGNSFEDIQNAIDIAADGDTIELSGIYTNETIINVDKTVNIHGNGETILDLSRSGTAFSIDANDVTLSNLRINKGSIIEDGSLNFTCINCTLNGGGVYGNGRFIDCTFANSTTAIHGDASAINCTFINNGLDDYGGNPDYAVFCKGEMESSFINSTFINNMGGAIHLSGDKPVSIRNCAFIDNTVEYDGVIYGDFDECNVEIADCIFRGNWAYESGAAIFGPLSLMVKNCSFIGNTAYAEGGAIFGCTAIDCTFINNSADLGGAISTGYAINSTFIENSANSGGASYISICENCSFVNNTAYAEGGAMIGESAINCTFIENSAQNGGAVFEADTFNSTFIKNSAREFGGAICNSSFISKSIFKDNYAPMGGAAYLESYYDEEYTCYVEDSKFENNSADYGGAIYGNGDVNILKSEFENNYAEWNGGAIHLLSSKHVSESEDGDEYDVAHKLNISQNSKFIQNEAHYGGAVSIEAGSDLIGKFYLSQNVLFKNNTAEYGGGLYLSGTQFNISQTSFDSNHAESGDGIYYDDFVVDKKQTKTGGNYTEYAIFNQVSFKNNYFGGAISRNSNLITVQFDSYYSGKGSVEILSKAGKLIKSLESTFVSGKTQIKTKDIPKGDYIISIHYALNERVSIKIPAFDESSKGKSTLALSATSNDDEVSLTAFISPTNASGSVLFTVDNKNYSVKISSGKANITITGLKNGNYTAEASYAGNSYFNSSNGRVNFEVRKRAPTEIIYNNMSTAPVSTADGRIGDYFFVRLVDSEGNPLAGLPIKIGFNGKIYDRNTTSNGGAKLQINLPREDIYTFAVCFLGDDDYMGSFAVAMITVDKKNPKPNKANENGTGSPVNLSNKSNGALSSIKYSNMNTKSVLKTDGRIGEYFQVKLLDNNGKALAGFPIKIGFNGKTYDRTTDSLGSAKLQINLPRPSLYTFAIAFLGDSKYQGSFAVAKITVKAQNPKITAKSLSYKANAKSKKISATLMSERGKPISGQKITFTVNGKTYTGKTNSKGLASVNVSLNKKGSYSCTIKFAGMTGLNAKSTKITVKIV